jgi:hypothetical protein
MRMRDLVRKVSTIVVTQGKVLRREIGLVRKVGLSRELLSRELLSRELLSRELLSRKDIAGKVGLSLV